MKTSKDTGMWLQLVQLLACCKYLIGAALYNPESCWPWPLATTYLVVLAIGPGHSNLFVLGGLVQPDISVPNDEGYDGVATLFSLSNS